MLLCRVLCPAKQITWWRFVLANEWRVLLSSRFCSPPWLLLPSRISPTKFCLQTKTTTLPVNRERTHQTQGWRRGGLLSDPTQISSHDETKNRGKAKAKAGRGQCSGNRRNPSSSAHTSRTHQHYPHPLILPFLWSPQGQIRYHIRQHTPSLSRLSCLMGELENLPSLNHLSPGLEPNSHTSWSNVMFN